MEIKEIAENVYKTYRTRNPYTIIDCMGGIIVYTVGF
jgi:hypothetical protein